VTASCSLRCAVTVERVERATPELAAALALWNLRSQESRRAHREVLEPRLRVFGLVVSALGATLSGTLVALTPVSACPRVPLDLFPQLATPLFAVFGVLFWFLPRVTAELRAWAPGAVARRAPGMLASLRPHLPLEVEYELQAGRLDWRRSRPRASGSMPLRTFRGAVVGESLVCLFGPPPLSRLVRLLWLGDGADRESVARLLREAGIEVVEQESPAILPGE
jgi:hypothetical protein